jgi:tRNA-guanine family transglycosylase
MQPNSTLIGGHLHRLPMIWLGQSVDTSVLHVSIPEYRSLPVLTSLGCAIRRPSLLQSRFGPNLKSTLRVEGPLMLDSGGYAMMKNNAKSWTAKRVSAVYERVDADIVVALDIPPSLEDEPKVRGQKHRRTLRNLAVLAPKFGSRLMPVVHGRTPNEVERSCEGIRREVPKPVWIGVGGLVPLLHRTGFNRTDSANSPQSVIASTIHIVRSYFPAALLHVFGVGSIQTMLALFGLGAQSADSIGWRQAAGFGSIYIPGKSQRLLSWKMESKRPRPLISEADRYLLAKCECPVCRTIPQLQQRLRRLNTGFEPRSLHNLWVLRNEVIALAASRRENQEVEFLSRRLSDAWMSVVLRGGGVIA